MAHSYSKVTDNFDSLLGDDIIQPDDDFRVPQVSPPQQSQPQPKQSFRQQSQPASGSSHMFHINFYRAFFDLDSDSFFQKIQSAVNPFSWFGESQEEEDSATELYGFIWITGTLIFLMFVSSTGSNLLAEWIHSGDEDSTKYEYSFALLTMSISLFYGYNFFVPALLYIFTSYVLKFPQRLTLTRVISIYGYTNILWIPITLVNILIVVLISNKHHHFLLNIIEWSIVLLSGGITGFSNIGRLYPQLKQNSLLLNNGDSGASNRLCFAIVGALALAHLGFTIAVKVSFFGIKV